MQPEKIEAALDKILAENRVTIAKLLTNSTYTWSNLVQPLEEIEDRLDQFWAPISNLHGVAQTPALREAYNQCLPKLTAYHTEIAQNETLYKAFLNLKNNADYIKLNKIQQHIIDNELRDFKLSGIDLPPAAKQRYAEIRTQLAKLTTQFEENVMDATESWTLHITDKEKLTGIPVHILTTAAEAAQQKNLTGWLLTLDFPCYYAVISYADNRALRQEIYTAYITRASEQGPQAGQFDNSKIMLDILTLRKELSVLLDRKNYAEFALTKRMVKQPQDVLDFLTQLINHVRPKAEQEFRELSEFAQQEKLQPWDVTYYSEKLRQRDYQIDTEILRPYFPIEQVLQGMFTLIQRLYGMEVAEIKGVEAWHPDVRFFAIYDREKQLRGQFYLDLYTRSQKREGAWMDDCRQRRRLINNEIQTPIAYLTCNFTPPSQDKPALLTHDEVLTLFHEFGHGLHHMLTQIDYPEVAGIRGVEWDAVELPSQFMEFFVWQKEVLDSISRHYQTGASLPTELYQRLHKTKNFHSALSLLRQLEYALFDFRLHLEFNPTEGYAQIQKIMDEIRSQIAVVPMVPYNRFQHAFSHIFAGGYAAGYYSYLWAEMLASNAFAKFEEKGIFDPATGAAFLHTILERGSSADALELFIAFCGKKPSIDTLLRHYEITH